MNTTTSQAEPTLPWVIYKTPAGDWRGRYIATHERDLPYETAAGCVVVGRAADSTAAIRELFRLNAESRHAQTDQP